MRTERNFCRRVASVEVVARVAVVRLMDGGCGW